MPLDGLQIEQWPIERLMPHAPKSRTPIAKIAA
jgi:hypothetical protein